MPNARELLEQYVANGKLMQLATLRTDGSPAICNVWYDVHFAPDLLRFISRYDRNHSADIRSDERVAGSIVAIELEALGQVVRGVTFLGTAREMATVDVEFAISAFIERWPASAEAIDPGKLANGETPTRLYEVVIDEWILFDESNFPSQPRRKIKAVAGRDDPATASRSQAARPGQR
ncbi:MAG: pyridoxamine 5'-phosphate oxidase family protein [Actinobacteria bacterium]|nr:pyridoxamine 5'-phosphate oxidase family protein [Actinomycetota bacterium]